MVALCAETEEAAVDGELFVIVHPPLTECRLGAVEAADIRWKSFKDSIKTAIKQCFQAVNIGDENIYY